MHAGTRTTNANRAHDERGLRSQDQRSKELKMANRKPTRKARSLRAAIVYSTLATMIVPQGEALAQVTDIATAPLASSSTALVKPNILFVLDDSGSMSWSHMPDSIFDDPGQAVNWQVTAEGGLGWTGLLDKVGYRNHLCNTIYYNPNIKYLPPRKANGASHPNALFTDAEEDPYTQPGSNKVDLGSKFRAFTDKTCWNSGQSCSNYYDEKEQAAYYYRWKGTGSPVDAKFTNLRTGECAKKLSSIGSNWEKVTVSASSGPGGTDERTNFANWYQYYRTRMYTMKAAATRAFIQLGSQYRVGMITINPGSDVSSDKYLKIADFDTTQKAAWWDTLFKQEANGGTPLRQALARAGRHFAGYQDGINKGMDGDPVQYSCQQNFTILTTDGYWNGSGGVQLNGSTSIGNHDNTLSDQNSPRPIWDGSTTSASITTTTTVTYFQNNKRSDGVTNCNGSRRSNWRQTKTDTVTTSMSGTIALGSTTSTNTTNAIYDECKNPPGPNLPSGVALNTPVVTTATSSSGGTAASTNSLSDVAQYYYITDLRTSSTKPTGALGKDVTSNNVPSGGTGAEDDKAAWQHMTTFTLGLGLTGQLLYQSDYISATTGDFSSIRTGAKNWPVPVADSPTALDDLWHTAVNGRGQFFSASNPDSVVAGLVEALTGINARVASASAAATSNLEPVAGDNFAYTASYMTAEWTGELTAKTIDLTTGIVSTTPVWSAQTKLDKKVGKFCDNRTVYLFRGSVTNKLTDFKWNTQACDGAGAPTGSSITTLDSTEQGYFGDTVVKLFSHYGSMTDGTSGTVNQRSAAAGANLVNFLRGQSGNEGFIANDLTKLYRNRPHVLGDIVNAQPVFVKAPFAQYNDAGYGAFKSAQASRTPMVYTAANDGQLHAFYAGTSVTDTQGGEEAWSFIPTMVIDKLWKLADNNYANLHDYYTDGTPSVGDVYDAAAGAWKTILVAGLNGGGRGYYALDITNPASPKGLWEFKQGACYNPASSLPQSTDCNLGYSFGNPIMSKIAWSGYSEGRWVVFVTSGYNNVSGDANDGKGYLYALDAVTGDILFKLGTGVGTAAKPSGLGKINNWVNDTVTNNYTDRVYGVDLLGNIWRFDVNDSYGAAGREAQLVATVKDPSGNTQPLTTKPELAEVGSPPGPYIYVATGRYLGGTDIGNSQKQTIYAIRDDLGSTTLSDVRGTLIGRTVSTATTSGVTYRTVSCSYNCTATTDKGWFVDLPDTGERVNVDPKLQLGTLIVASNVPQNTECAIGGYSYLNFLDYKTGLAVSTAVNKSIGYKVADSLAVGLNVVRLPGGKTVVIVTTSDSKQTTGEAPVAPPGPGGRRISWRELVR
jgi:type IV pilus assembly protein PilY1